MDVEAVKAEIRRRMDAIGGGLPREKWDTGEWDSWATLSMLLEWIEAQQAAEIRAAEGFQGTTVTGDDLMRQHGMKE